MVTRQSRCRAQREGCTLSGTVRWCRVRPCPGSWTWMRRLLVLVLNLAVLLQSRYTDTHQAGHFTAGTHCETQNGKKKKNNKKIFKIHEAITQTQKYMSLFFFLIIIFYNWITLTVWSYNCGRVRHVSTHVTQYEIVLCFKVSLIIQFMQTWKRLEFVRLGCLGQWGFLSPK